MTRERTLLPRLALLHPAFWVGLLTLVVNDHVLKHAGVLPPLATGKLSDFAGLFVAPVVLAALVGARTTRVWLLCHAAVGAGFALVNVFPLVAAALGQVLTTMGIPSRLWCDPSDLVALPALWVSHRVFGATAARGSELRDLWRACVQRAGLGLGLLGCIATSRMPPPSIPGDAAHAYVPLPGDGQIAVLEASSGRELRRFEHTLYAFPRAVVIDGVIVGFGEVAGQHRLMGIDVATGALRYAVAVRGSSTSLPLLASGALALAVRPSDAEPVTHELSAYEARTGTLRWSRPVPDLADLNLHLGDGFLLVARDGAVEQVDPSTGARRWDLVLAGEVVAMTSLAGRAFVQLDDDTLLALDAETGRVLRRRTLDARTVRPWTRPEGSLAASDDALFVLADSGAYVLDVELRQRATVPGVLSVVARGPHVLATFGDSGIARLDPATGAVLWKVESLVSSDGPTLRGELVLVGGDDEVVALDLATGKPRWRWAYPHAR